MFSFDIIRPVLLWTLNYFGVSFSATSEVFDSDGKYPSYLRPRVQSTEFCLNDVRVVPPPPFVPSWCRWCHLFACVCCSGCVYGTFVYLLACSSPSRLGFSACFFYRGCTVDGGIWWTLAHGYNEGPRTYKMAIMKTCGPLVSVTCCPCYCTMWIFLCLKSERIIKSFVLSSRTREKENSHLRRPIMKAHFPFKIG